MTDDTPIAGPSPLDVACPRCGAKEGRACRTRTGYSADWHISRWEAVGVTKPTHDDRQRAYEDMKRRDLARRLEGLPTLAAVLDAGRH